MTIARGVAKELIMARQTALGTPAAVDAATAEYMRRITSNIDVSKESYRSEEIRKDRQVADMRHGVKSVGGNLTGELSPGSYQMLMASILQRDWTAGVSDSANDDIVAAATTGAQGTFTRDDYAESSAESAYSDWIADGFKVGDVIRMTGWAAPATANNNHNFLIINLTRGVMTVLGLDGNPPVAKAAGDPVVTSVQGKKTYAPLTGHTNDYYSIEHHFSDIDKSELFVDCKMDSMAITLPPSGMSGIDIPVMGLNMFPYDTSEAPYFTGPTAMSEYGVLAAVNGALIVENTAVALLTGMDFTISSNVALAEPVVGSNLLPDVFLNRITVSGNMTVYFTNVTFRDYFTNETEISLASAFTTSSEADADFLAFAMPRVKVGGATKDDGEKGLVQTMPFEALLNVNGGASVNSEETTISIQDSTL